MSLENCTGGSDENTGTSVKTRTIKSVISSLYGPVKTLLLIKVFELQKYCKFKMNPVGDSTISYQESSGYWSVGERPERL